MNRLQYETSPYLRQHAENPVDWYPWGEEALQIAREQDKPILLSIGYSACHWCHVMAHESFEDPATAEMMNRAFVNIKVDREERPDLDDIYMKATQIYQNGNGGWPMTVFLTPTGKPFHAGTYYPLQARYGMPSFQQVMQAVLDAFTHRREEVEQASAQVTHMLQAELLPSSKKEIDLDETFLDKATLTLISRADQVHGGLHTGAPKFPNPMNLDYLLRYAAQTQNKSVLNIACFTLEKMAKGGIYDQLGGGFARYSVDERWLVPHFEKMLYDNAQLARVYLHAYQLTRADFFKDISLDILAYVKREMLDPNGGFYSSQDADSEGEEGKFYVWSEAELEAVLKDHLEAETLQALKTYWDVTAGGNFEGQTILHVDAEDRPEKLAEARQILFQHREGRIKPHRDEKMLAAWNGMMLAAFAEAGRIFPEADYTNIAQANADFILTALTMPDGRLYRTHKDGDSKLNAYLEDYACVIDGLLELYQTDFNPRWFTEAQRLTDYTLAHFPAEDGAGFYDTSDEHETLIARPRTFQDNAVPSGNNLMAYNLLRLGAYTGQAEYEEAALGIFRQTLAAVQQYPQAFGTVLTGLNMLIRRPVEVAIIGGQDESRPILADLQTVFRPQVITALAEKNQDENAMPALLAHRSRRNDAPTIYVCQNFACAAPVNTAAEMEKLLAGI